MKEFEGYEFSQKELEIILGISKPQAWRIYTGKSKLTESNKRLIKLHFESLEIRYKILEEKSKYWCESECDLLKNEDPECYVSWSFMTVSGESHCKIHKVTDEHDIEYVRDIVSAIESAKTTSLGDELQILLDKELANHVIKEKVIKIK